MRATAGYLDHDGPIAFAHRGFSLEGLENSMVAFQAAVDLGYAYVETDVHATADGVAIAFHDASLDRVTDRTGRIAGLSWSQVRQARIGGREPVPTLAEVLHAWPDLRVNIDVKSAGAIAPTVAVIERESAHDRVLVGSFSEGRRRATLEQLSRPVATSASTAGATRFLLGARTRWDGLVARVAGAVDCLQVPERAGRTTVVDARTLEVAHAHGLKVHVWTVNDPADMRRLLDLGVDGLVTDRADLLQEVLRPPPQTS
ncbi:glycerophosphodiester phosphodiesterase [Isoptericola sp. b441]|uniref:Glycerophosphodiester phosphodiesterase n=1 Tax=Actinotalea lenta TaxID=3064654 RepID=A0ABT9D8N5_9CELL|nr:MULTISPECIES: glycerophosphodiester phosphodiesterase [unclassified Isoptericola]MDO8106915.1 glycerophosphodiester phosphodiesterase [Isoptericola sp. b441]MDO8121374.1 glycerophosphodiester phosphodiesterase [Isoptericola sp. b490]